MKNKFEVLNDELLDGVRTLVYFQKMRFPIGVLQPDSIVVGYSDASRFKLHPDPEVKVLDGRTGRKETLWRVMHNWSPMVGEVVEAMFGQPDLRSGRYRSVDTFRVGSVSVVQEECHVRLDPDPGSRYAT